MMSLFRLMVRGNIVMVYYPIEYRILLFNLNDSSAVVLRFNMAVVRVSFFLLGISWTNFACASSAVEPISDQL